LATERDKTVFKIDHKSSGFKIHFSAELENLDKIEQATSKFLAINVTSEILFNILLIMREALNNAVYHGCGLDKTKSVRYALTLKENSIVMEIEDDGSGFDWYHVKGSGAPLDATHGRRLAIMQKFSDEMKYSNNGTLLRLSINIG